MTTQTVRATMTESAAKGFGRKAARDQRKGKHDCTAELGAFRALYGYEHSEAFIAGYWAERIAIEYTDFNL